jgi:hypothetical protein
MPQVTLTLKTDEGNTRPREMREALQGLIGAGLLPSTGLKITFSVATEDDADDLEELLNVALEDRSYVIEAEIEIKTKRGIKRKIAERRDDPTPMDNYLAQMA